MSEQPKTSADAGETLKAYGQAVAEARAWAYNAAQGLGYPQGVAADRATRIRRALDKLDDLRPAALAAAKELGAQETLGPMVDRMHRDLHLLLERPERLWRDKQRPRLMEAWYQARDDFEDYDRQVRALLGLPRASRDLTPKERMERILARTRGEKSTAGVVQQTVKPQARILARTRGEKSTETRFAGKPESQTHTILPEGRLTAPKRPELDAERERVRVRDGQWYDLTPSETHMLRILFEAEGGWIKGAVISKRASHTKRDMKKPVRDLIESGKQGYRIPLLLPQ